MKVQEFVQKASERLASVTPDMGIHEVAEKLAEPLIDLVVVTDEGGKLVGVVTDTDIVNWVAKAKPGEPWDATAKSLMSTDVFSCTPDQVFGTVVDEAVKRKRKHFPIVNESREPIGVVYVSDALIILHKEDHLSSDAVMAYIHQRGRFSGRG